MKKPGYNSWSNMKQRTGNPNHPRFGDWGGRGITLCDKWLTFAGFIEDMGDPPSVYHSIERRDNDKGYTKGNCYWATKTEQCLNQRLRKDNTLGIRGISSTGTAYRVNLHRNGVKHQSRSIRSLEDTKELRDHLLEELV